ncbi:MAG: sporulation protein YunB [Clostridia bacterium]|nr:sporulation protein YunB [Clostridia bacterium]
MKKIRRFFTFLKPRRIIRISVILLLLLSAAYLMLERNLTQVILDTAYTRAHALAVETMNEAVQSTLMPGVAYEELVAVRVDAQGKVTMLQANTVRMNELAVHIALAAQEALTERDEPTITVPLGAALQVPFLSSVGPRITVGLLPVGAVKASFATEFESAGINQTRHKIWLEMHAAVRLVLPTGAKAVNVDTQILIAESIIIGEVPSSYIHVPETDDSLNFAVPD